MKAQAGSDLPDRLEKSIRNAYAGMPGVEILKLKWNEDSSDSYPLIHMDIQERLPSLHLIVTTLAIDPAAEAFANKLRASGEEEYNIEFAVGMEQSQPPGKSHLEPIAAKMNKASVFASIAPMLKRKADNQRIYHRLVESEKSHGIDLTFAEFSEDARKIETRHLKIDQWVAKQKSIYGDGTQEDIAKDIIKIMNAFEHIDQDGRLHHYESGEERCSRFIGPLDGITLYGEQETIGNTDWDFDGVQLRAYHFDAHLPETVKHSLIGKRVDALIDLKDEDLNSRTIQGFMPFDMRDEEAEFIMQIETRAISINSLNQSKQNTVTRQS